VADQIYATMHAMQTPLCDPTCDRSSANARSGELRTRHDSMLCCGKRRNRRIDGTCLELCITVVHNAGDPPALLTKRYVWRVK
jgi:hypothetical protein